MKSGIYQITNLTTKRAYIGSAVNFHRRSLEHFRKLSRNEHENIHLQRLYNKYGKFDFEVCLIEECEKNLLIQREQYYIDKLEPIINICRIAGSSLGRKVTPAQKYAASLMKKGKRYHSDYQIQRIKETHIGKTVTDKARYCRARIIIQVSLEGRDVEEYRSINEAVRRTGINNIAAVLRGNQRIAGGYRWRYKDQTTKDIENLKNKHQQVVQNRQEGHKKATIKRFKKVLQINIETNEIVNEFDSLKQAELMMNGKPGPNISSCICGRQKSAYNYKWKLKK